MQTDRQMEMWLGRLRHAYRQTARHRQAGDEADRLTDRQTGRQRGRQSHKQTDRPMEIWVVRGRHASGQTSSLTKQTKGQTQMRSRCMLCSNKLISPHHVDSAAEPASSSASCAASWPSWHLPWPGLPAPQPTAAHLPSHSFRWSPAQKSNNFNTDVKSENIDDDNKK